MPTLYERIGQKIRELRLARPEGPLSQEALGTAVEVSGNTVSRWETGTYKPTPDDLDKLARYFRISITAFFPDSIGESQEIRALTSALGGLDKADLEEVIRYAEYRKARRALESTKRVRKR